MCNQNLLKEIEATRAKMVSLATSSSLSDKEVIKTSEKLDSLLIKFQKESQNKKQ